MSEQEEINSLQREVRTLDSFQHAVKILINQAYGAFGSPYFYFANRDIASSITAQGRNLIHFSIDAVNNYFLNVWHKDTELHKKLGVDTSKIKKINDKQVIYVDTDSNYVNFNSLIESVEGLEFGSRQQSAQFVIDVLNERFTEYLKMAFDNYGKYYKVDNRMVFKMEKVCSQAIWIAKKMYAYRTIYEDYWLGEETHASGLPCTKPSYPKKSREIMWRMLDILLDVNNKIVLELDIVPKLKEEFEMFKKCDIDDICYNKFVRSVHKYAIPISDYDLVTESVVDENGKKSEVQYAVNKTTGKYHTVETKKKGIQKGEITETFGGYYLVKGCGGETKGCIRYNNRLLETGNTKYLKIKSNDKIKSYYTNNLGEMFCYAPEDFDSEVCDAIDYREQFFNSVVKPINAILVAIGKNELTSNFTRAISYKKPLVRTMKNHNNDIFEVQFWCVNKSTGEHEILDKKFNKYALNRDKDITDSKLLPEDIIREYDKALSLYGENLVLVAEEEVQDYLKKRNLIGSETK